MVDRQKRAEAAKLIDDYFSGRTTNFEYDDHFPSSDSDPALHAIHTMLWFNYSDVCEKRFDARKINAEGWDFLDQVQLFLRSDYEYIGPRNLVDPFAIPKRFWYWITRRPRPSLPDCWPFETELQLQNARMTRNSQ
jgi:hypothetical protein